MGKEGEIIYIKGEEAILDDERNSGRTDPVTGFDIQRLSRKKDIMNREGMSDARVIRKPIDNNIFN